LHRAGFRLPIVIGRFTTSPHWAILWIAAALSGLGPRRAAAPPPSAGHELFERYDGRGGTDKDGLHHRRYIVGATRPFTGAFLVAGVVLVVGIVAYVFILGRREPIADPPAA
jgi:hypothetical protein